MKPVDQLVLHDPANGKEGDCFRACLASIMELPIECIPNFAQETVGKGSAAFWNAIYDWLELTGHSIKFLSFTDPEVEEGKYYIISGPSPRSGHHAVVGLGKGIVHDPHPSRAGLKGEHSEWRWMEIAEDK